MLSKDYERDIVRTKHFHSKVTTPELVRKFILKFERARRLSNGKMRVVNLLEFSLSGYTWKYLTTTAQPNSVILYQLITGDYWVGTTWNFQNTTVDAGVLANPIIIDVITPISVHAVDFTDGNGRGFLLADDTIGLLIAELVPTIVYRNNYIIGFKYNYKDIPYTDWVRLNKSQKHQLPPTIVNPLYDVQD